MAGHNFITMYLLSPKMSMNMADLSLGPWGVGGFQGPEIPCGSNCGATISNLSVKPGTYAHPGGVSFSCSNKPPLFGGEGHDDLAIAGFFCWIESPRWGEPHWFGGKVEWIRASRCAFGLTNAKDYNGWGWNAIIAAKKFGLVVCAKSGGNHSNFIECSK